jgi:biopolymer transport protein ExbD
MSMNVGPASGSRDPEVMIDINTTPLIDVMLVLLVMLIITIPIQLHSVNLNMPVGNPPPPTTPPEVVKIDITPTGTMDWGGGKTYPGTIFWNGEAIVDRATLEYRLQTAAQQPVQPELHLRPDKASKYELAAGVMASSQRFGLTKIGIVGSEQFIDE